ncbi:MAG TPA: two-component regulator propeller domain-containing protein, partial [Flavobacteriaceae bacterium]|nr:two-component regulator propeller domain-containing protein [Flavobacteriaceae bacterium]
NIHRDSVLGARDLNSIAINPFNPSQVFIGSYNDGMLEVNDDQATVLYNHTNSGLEYPSIPGAPNYITIRIGPMTFDSQGKLWTTTARLKRPLKAYDLTSGEWQSHDFSVILPDEINSEWGYSDVVIDNNGNKWLGGYINGVIGYSENNGVPIIKTISTQEQNLPSTFVTALAVDNRNQLWVGTISGLRVLYNTSGFFTNDNPELDSIIIVEDDGVPAELMFQQYISSIEVDGSNNKWVGTYSTGLYYFTSDGQETIHHFTTDNSPLPSNNIIDISLDQNTGVLYVATDRGLLSYSSGASGTQEDLASAFVYPNPVRPTFNITEDKIKIKDISENVNIKITDIEGNLVAEAQSRTNLRYKGYNLEIDGGIAYWNGKNLGNNVVASGVYLIMLTDLDSLETKVLKVMVIR